MMPTLIKVEYITKKLMTAEDPAENKFEIEKFCKFRFHYIIYLYTHIIYNIICLYTNRYMIDSKNLEIIINLY